MAEPAVRGPVPVVPALLFGGALVALAVWWFWDPAAVGAKPQDWALQDPRNPAYSTDPDDPFPMPPELAGVRLLGQSNAERDAKSTGCVRCHQYTGDPHGKPTLRIGCTDCHGGDASASEKEAAHISPRYPQFWPTSANPVRSYALLNHESPEFIRFVNPGDLRVAHISCGTAGCHPQEVQTNRKQIMSTGCMLWGAALYNNGSVPFKKARFGEAYGMNGASLRLVSVPPPTEYEVANHKGVLPYLDPLPRFEMSQPGNVLRFFERGGRFRPEVGIPERLEEPGRPRTRLSERGLGTENRTDPVLVSLNKTRLFDPTLNFLGTNDQPGDYRSSGCSACHVVYANDRSPVHAGQYAKFGNRGTSQNPDPTIPGDERGHPIDHKFTNSIPTSQCIVCHIHPGTTVMNSYLGYMWWDQETEGHLMYPRRQKNPTAEEAINTLMRNPEESAVRGNWGDPAFLDDLVALNPLMDRQQFADFHGHGWIFRAVFKRDREGFLLDHDGQRLPNAKARDLMRAVQVPCQVKQWHKDNRFEDARAAVEAERKLNAAHSGTPVHLLDIHLEKGMHCVDCHFSQDEHGNNRLHQEVRAATEIQCIDCHGTATEYTTLRTSGPAAYTSSPDGKGRNLAALRTPFGKPRFETETDADGRTRYFQNSMVEKGLRWEVVQTKDTTDPAHPRYNAKSAIAKTVRVEGGKMVWGDHPGEEKCAHANKNMSCIACHSSWNPSCYGCHLPQRANVKMPMLHADGDVTRNFTPYNFQTLRDDIYMLARDGDVTGNRINPARSSCAIHVSSYNNNRESIYTQQQTLSADGYAGTAFSTNVPHTVRGRGARETKQCTDCHLSKANDNNAWMAQLLMHGTNYLNLIGKYCWVGAGEEGLYGVVVTEQTEPQAVIGSTLHAVAYPDNFSKHCARHGELEVGHEHPGRDISEGLFKPHQHNEILNLQLRGEYLYAACGEGGLRAFDVAMIDNKAFAERITTTPVSPLGQRFHVPTKFATSVAVPSTAAVDPTRKMNPENKEQPIAGYFGYVYVTDKYEGLILVGIGVMVDGHPDNNFLKRDLTFNPDGLLNGAASCTIVGHYAYVCCDAGLVVISLEDPTQPKVTCVLGEKEHIHHPHAVQCQFRYAYLCDEEGVKVLDITDLSKPAPRAQLRIPDVHNIYLARTYAYLAAGPRGLVILDIKEAEKPKLAMIYTADGRINDAHDVKLGITYNTEFAYVADGKHGLRVVQLTGPDTPGNDGFSPRPTPRLIATFKIPFHGHALAISKGLDRDRAVDEDGHQIGVFGRVGARPLNAVEQRKMYLRDGKPWFVSDDPLDALYQERRAGRATVEGR
jgi:formate-dependent nitrite reductase cytochrome c552 subunit